MLIESCVNSTNFSGIATIQFAKILINSLFNFGGILIMNQYCTLSIEIKKKLF